MSIRLLCRIVLGICVAATGIAEAQPARPTPVPSTRTAPKAATNRVSHTCPDTNRADLVFLQSGGVLEYPSGTFMSADVRETQPGSGWVLADCNYGVQYSSPGLSPVYRVSYKIVGFNGQQCTVSGKTVTCER